MKTVTGIGLASVVCALLLVNPAAAATAAKKSTPAVGKKATATATQARKAWPAESLSGTIQTVNPDRKLMVVKSSDGTPFDMIVTPKTHIQSGKQTVALKDLAQYQNKAVSVKYVPERRGDVAKRIDIGG